jgi:ketosteroid isomerase-like protein
MKSMDSALSDPRLARLAQAYEALRRDNLDALLSLYGEQALFKDPFNEVRGHAAIGRVFSHMFEQLDQPRFAVSHGAVQGDSGFLLWELVFLRASGQPMRICGTSYLQFDAQGRVAIHRDFWDPLEEIFAKVPVLGAVARGLQNRLRAPQ